MSSTDLLSQKAFSMQSENTSIESGHESRKLFRRHRNKINFLGENGGNLSETTDCLNYSPVVRLKYGVCQEAIRQYKEVVYKVIVKHYYPYKNLNGRCCVVLSSSTCFTGAIYYSHGRGGCRNLSILTVQQILLDMRLRIKWIRKAPIQTFSHS